MKKTYESPTIRLSSDVGFIVSNHLCAISKDIYVVGGPGTYKTSDGTINDYSMTDFD